MSREAMKLALEALENSIDLVSHEARNAEELYGKYPTRLARIQGLVAFEVAHEKAIAALRQALANEALDKKAENARELGLDYEPLAGTQVSKVWWDGEKLMAKPIPLKDFYEPAQQEPVAWLVECGGDSALVRHTENFPGIFAGNEFNKRPLVFGDKSPPTQRKPLTDEQISNLWCEVSNTDFVTADTHEFARAIEAAYGIKENT